MSSSAVHNLLRGTGETVDSDRYGIVEYELVEPLVVGREYTVSAYVEELVRTPLPSGVDRPVLALYDGAGWWSGGNLSGDVPGVQTLTFTYKQPIPGHADPDQIWLYNTPKKDTGVTRRARLRDVMLVEGTEPYAWAPADGETLAGGGVGALMSANLLDGLKTQLWDGTTAESDGTWHHAARTEADSHRDWLVWDLPGQAALATNQTYHVGLSVRGASANAASLHATIGYKDAAGKVNLATSSALAIGTSWGRVEGTLVVPSGMRPFALYVAAYGTCPETWMAAPTLSLGSPVCLASSAHTPYATQDHVSVTYATKASLKVTDDSVKAEVSARAQTDKTVSEISTRLTQTADGLHASIDSLSETDKKINSWFDFKADASGNPQLKMGSSTSRVVGIYTNTGLAYKSLDGATIMELDASRSATVADHIEAQDVKIGKWKWIQTQDGTHLTLVWAG